MPSIISVRRILRSSLASLTGTSEVSKKAYIFAAFHHLSTAMRVDIPFLTAMIASSRLLSKSLSRPASTNHQSLASTQPGEDQDAHATN